MTTDSTESPRHGAGDEAGGAPGTRPTGDTTRHLRVVDTVEELRAEIQRLREWGEVMMTQAASQRVRADRLDVLLEQARDTNQRLRRLAQHLIDRFGTVQQSATTTQNPDDTEPVW